MQKLEMIIQYTLFTLISSKLTVHCAPVHRSNAAPVRKTCQKNYFKDPPCFRWALLQFSVMITDKCVIEQATDSANCI